MATKGKKSKSVAKAKPKKGAAKGKAKSKAPVKKAKATAKGKSKSSKASTPVLEPGMPVATATMRHVRISPRKARLVIDLIRGKQVDPALQILKFSPKKTAVIARKLLESAIANAREQARADVDRLWVTGGWVDSGRTMKRYMPAAHGRATPIKKRSSHITICLGEK